jgi:hypothetical protein
MKKITFGLFALAVVGCIIFYACKKEEIKSNNEEIKNTVNNGIEKFSATRWIVQWANQHKGSGKGKEKVCVKADGTCCLWGRTERMDSEIFSGGVAIVVVVVKPDPAPKPDESNSENPGTNNWIRLDFKNKYNSEAMLQDLFNMSENCFVIKEDIIEEDGDLLTIMETTSPCIIPAGKYPIHKYEEGITVDLPVIIK